MALLITHRTMVLVFGGHVSSIDGIVFFRRGPVVRRLPRMAFNLTDIGGIGGGKTLNSAFSSPPTTRQVGNAGRSKSEKHQAPTTLSLLPGVDVSTEDQTINNTDQNAPKSMELFPQHAGIDSESVRIPSNIKTEKAQLTIFYCGKVLVFDDFPADKAEDLLQMASKESIAAQKIAFTAPSSSTGADCSSQLETAHANASDMPIARKNSLHRFLMKRKDRISTKAPYQVHGGTEAPDLGKP